MPSDKGTNSECKIDPATGLSDTIAYCGQAPWLLSATIMENITFGNAWNSKRYNEVIKACALVKDFDIFEHRDQKQVGEKGRTCECLQDHGGHCVLIALSIHRFWWSTVSGSFVVGNIPADTSRRARIALARALYSPAKTVILDDVLSAVDASTARHLYQQCLKGDLMKGRTVLLVTHAVGLVLPGAAFVVVLDSGSVLAAGPPSELLKEGHFSEEHTQGSDIAAHERAEEDSKDITVELSQGVASGRANEQKNAQISASRDNFIKAEGQEQGMVAWSTYKLYYSSFGNAWFWILSVILFVGAQGAQVETNAWIRTWVNASGRRSSSFAKRVIQVSLADTMVATPSRDETAWYLGIYVAINVLFAFMVGARITWLFTGSLQASRSLCERLLRRIFSARMRCVLLVLTARTLRLIRHPAQVLR